MLPREQEDHHHATHQATRSPDTDARGRWPEVTVDVKTLLPVMVVESLAIAGAFALYVTGVLSGLQMGALVAIVSVLGAALIALKLRRSIQDADQASETASKPR